MDDTEPNEETLRPSSGPQPAKPNLTLDKAIEFGEYDPEYLAQFPEWHKYTKHMQFELIKKALANRRRQLLFQWMEINKSNDYQIKPHLIAASDSVNKQLIELTSAKEKIYAKYSMDGE